MAADNPKVVEELRRLVVAIDQDLGIEGKGPGCRELGKVSAPKPLIDQIAHSGDEFRACFLAEFLLVTPGVARSTQRPRGYGCCSTILSSCSSEGMNMDKQDRQDLELDNRNHDTVPKVIAGPSCSHSKFMSCRRSL